MSLRVFTRLNAIDESRIEALDYLFGWWETHPDEFPDSFEDLQRILDETIWMLAESEEGSPLDVPNRSNEIYMELKKEGY